MLSKKLISPALIALFFFTSPLTAEDSIGGYKSVHGRTQNGESNNKTDVKKALHQACLSSNGAENTFIASSSHMEHPKFTLTHYTVPINCHWLTNVSDENYLLELEDGSCWAVSPSDAYILRRWRKEDFLVITPNYSWLSTYNYSITNRNTNSSVKANLHVGLLHSVPTAIGSEILTISADIFTWKIR